MLTLILKTGIISGGEQMISGRNAWLDSALVALQGPVRFHQFQIPSHQLD